VSTPQDVLNLRALGRANLAAAIVGKALYDGRTTVQEMNDAAARDL
jgi:phosphoribosylformimino-5-aminoimidazole carboxamide ribonucleotide (ProFAR) isomerase